MTKPREAYYVRDAEYAAMSAAAKFALHSLSVRLPYWDALYHTQAVIAATLAEGRSENDVFRIITRFAARYPDPAVGFADAHGDGRLQLANLLRFGAELPDSKHAGKGRAAVEQAALPVGLSATTDTDEISKRASLVPPVWPDGTVGAVSANAEADYQALVSDTKNQDIAPSILFFKARMSGGGYVMDLSDKHGLSWADFCAEFTAPRGQPGDGTEK